MRVHVVRRMALLKPFFPSCYPDPFLRATAISKLCLVEEVRRQKETPKDALHTPNAAARFAPRHGAALSTLIVWRSRVAETDRTLVATQSRLPRLPKQKCLSPMSKVRRRHAPRAMHSSPSNVAFSLALCQRDERHVFCLPQEQT